MSDTTASNSLPELQADATRSSTFGANANGRQYIVNDGTSHLTKPLISTKGWTLAQLVKKSPDFHPVDRVHFDDPMLMQTIRMHEDSGTPLIIEGFHEHESWPADLFTLDWLSEHGKPGASARNVRNWADFDLPLSELIRKLRATPIYASENETERLYGKDAECPHEWATWLSTSGVLPSDLLPHGTNDYLKHLPSDVQTLMCYLGVGDTFTPFHKDLCASSGQNLMCYTENGGSSFWFMTESSAASAMAEFFHKMNEELDFETHVVTLKELGKSKLKIYIAEQNLGDLVLVPPRSCHQVINNGGITMKTSWSRMTLKGLSNSLYHELPVYHRVCRSETYKVKLNIYRALQYQTQMLRELQEQQTNSPHPDRSSPTLNLNLERVADDLHHLLELLDDVLGEEYSPKHQHMPHVSQSDTCHQTDITCDFCGADIFQSFFECTSCALHLPSVNDEMKIGDGIVVCSLCYVEGRGCNCGSMNPTQCQPFGDLLRIRDEALHVIRAICPDIVKDYECLMEHSNSIISARHVGVFTAALVLYERLNMEESLRMCLSKHHAPRSSIIYCALCHVGRCMTHILEGYHTHSAPALLMSDSTEGWHSYHKQSKAAFKGGYAQILHDEETGARPDFRMKLAYVASKFRTCKSVNPNATMPGWYDKCIELTSASVASSPLKQATTQSSSEATFDRPQKPSLSTASLFRRSASFSDLTSLPSDFQGSSPGNRAAGALDIHESLSTTQQHPGVPPANTKKRRFVLDFVSVPHPPCDGPSSSMFDDTTKPHIRSMSDENGTFLSMRSSTQLDASPRTRARDVSEEHEQLDASAGGSNGRPPKKQRVGPPGNGLSSKEPLRVEKRASNGKVYLTNKPQFPIELLPDSHKPSKKAAGNKATPNNVPSMDQEQLRLALAENEKLRVANAELKKDKAILENEICALARHNEDLVTMATSFRAQSRKTRNHLLALVGQGVVNPPSISAPPVGRHQEAMHRRGSLTGTISYTEAPHTQPRFLAQIMDGAILHTQTHETDHTFRIGRRSVGRFPPIQDTLRHELETGGPRKDTAQQSRTPSDEENYPPEMLVAEPTRTQSQASVSDDDEGIFPSLLETETSSDDMDG
ncbi:hypothetical protein DEU56DRAFT_905932 [Suillus clintonianus]|uniref:uncharacterized protein n=1 Tax=Suillus clintonianus TaxID=1904413 RepID=UPI001B869AE5|nr:uncharacterized protein DEU56DRAFT_905932 [Suillus clintonianus]KAG2157278.1 hypothetical protein DEU56DRAFT_905932 [Suillus clintonianus]